MRKNLRNGLVFATMLLGAAAAVATYAWRGPGDSGELRCVWQKDLALEFDLKVNSTAILHDKVFGGGSRSLHYTAKLAIVAAEDKTFAAALRDVEGIDDRDLKQLSGLDHPFHFRMDEDCRLTKFGFAAADGRASRDFKKALLVSMEVVGPSKELKKPGWQATQTDMSGVFVAAYQAASEERKFFRKKLFYKSVDALTADLQLKAEIENSQLEFERNENGFWLSQLQLGESLRLKTTEGEPFAESSAHIELNLTEGNGKALEFRKAETLAWEAPKILSKTSEFSNSEYNQKVLEPSPYKSLQDVLTAFHNRQVERGRIDHDAVSEMVQFLTQKPGAVQELLNRIKSGTEPEDSHAMLFFVLEKTGTPTAQRALAEVLRDGEFSEMNRMRAAHAMANVRTPIPESVDALIASSQTYTENSDMDEAVPSTAALALGALDRNQRTLAPELAEKAGRELVQQLAQSQDDSQRSVLLAALGNTGDARHAELVTGYLQNEESIVRVAAARGLSRIGAENLDQQMLDAVAREKIVGARKAIAEAWSASKGHKAIDIPKMEATLSAETDADVRVHLVDVLGEYGATEPAAKAVLARQYQRDKEVKVKVRIGRYLKANELRASVL